MAHPGRPWSDDPDLVAAYERTRLRISADVCGRRDLFGWSQEQLARVSETHPNAISTLERLTIDPRLSTIVRVYYALGWYVDLRGISTRERGKN